MGYKLVADVENTVQWRVDNTIDGSPHNPLNRLVSVGWAKIFDDGVIGPTTYRFFHHNDLTATPAELAAWRQELQDAIDGADTVIGHNVKHDVQWLEECGFVLDDKPLEDTMIREYLLARSRSWGFSLADSCERRKVALKKSELVDGYFKQRIGYEAMPIAVVEEYGRGDIQSTVELYIAQNGLYADDWNVGLLPVLVLSNEFCRVLVDIERNGLQIDAGTLAQTERELILEREQLTAAIQEQIYAFMGDRPINPASGEMMSWVIYSRAVEDKKVWAETFQIGDDPATGKPKRRPRMSKTEFQSTVSKLCRRVYKQKAHQCPVCHGTGKIRKTKKDGSPFAKEQNCKNCVKRAWNPVKEKWEEHATGLVYEDLKQLAGLKFSPTGVGDCAQGGFSTDKETLTNLAEHARFQGREEVAVFLENLIRLNAVETYLSNFCKGIARGIQPDGRIHPKFNQCVTKTGRLSSTEPNFQNLPRGGTLTIKRCIVSRFEGGRLIEADFAGLEFVGAAELSKCPAAYEVIVTEKDPHTITAMAIYDLEYAQVDKKTHRQSSKPHTFAPLYGATAAGKAPHVARYYEAFPELYPGIATWQDGLCEQVLRTKIARLPSGREYAYPHARRTAWGSVNCVTTIKNYSVQGWSTADLVPLSLIRLRRLMRLHKVRALIINTVHDSILVDCPPDEIELMKRLIAQAMLGLPGEIKERWSYECIVPINAEMQIGVNYLDAEVELNKKQVRELLDA